MKRWIIALGIAFALLLGLTGTALADANPRASCIGIGSSSLQPGERAHAAHDVKEHHEDFGFRTPGQLYSFFAHRHAGSEAACFAGFE